MLALIPPTAQHLFDLTDRHGVLLAEFDFFPEQQVLWVRWHGHLTEASVIKGTQIGVALRQNGIAPRRLLSDESNASGNWREAVPWMQYEWLPNALSHGLRAMAFVLSSEPNILFDHQDLLNDARRAIPYQLFHDPTVAWHWLVQQA